MERMTFVKSRGLCTNCLVLGHRESLYGKRNAPYLFTNKPINFFTKLNWKLVKSLQDRGFSLWPNIFAKEI